MNFLIESHNRLVYEARYLAWNCELKTRLSDTVSHLRNKCRQLVIIAVFFFLFFLFYSIMRFKENSLPDSSIPR